MPRSNAYRDIRESMVAVNHLSLQFFCASSAKLCLALENSPGKTMTSSYREQHREQILATPFSQEWESWLAQNVFQFRLFNELEKKPPPRPMISNRSAYDASTGLAS